MANTLGGSKNQNATLNLLGPTAECSWLRR